MINASIESYYQNNLSAHGAGAQGVGWKNEEAQHVRFEQLLKVIYSKGPFTINDIGCGVGDLSAYISAKKIEYQYVGYDVLDEMVTQAKLKYPENGSRRFEQVNDLAQMKEADYCVASGIFNLKFEVSEESWKEYIIETIRILHGKSKLGFSFNALTSYSDKDFMKPELHYSNPAWLFDYCKTHFAKNVALLHDYSQYDFTILVKKNF
jgi:cyclopropane fatty-acyl-phospholipid synthase-like methyltransferase